jgi:hypothetical protein
LWRIGRSGIPLKGRRKTGGCASDVTGDLSIFNAILNSFAFDFRLEIKAVFKSVPLNLSTTLFPQMALKVEYTPSLLLL